MLIGLDIPRRFLESLVRQVGSDTRCDRLGDIYLNREYSSVLAVVPAAPYLYARVVNELGGYPELIAFLLDTSLQQIPDTQNRTQFRNIKVAVFKGI